MIQMQPIMLFIVAVAALALDVFAAEPARPGPSIQGRCLFLDESLLDPARTEGIRLVVNPPEINERILRLDKPWESLGLAHHGIQILEVNRRYHLYYRVYRMGTSGGIGSGSDIAVAISNDAVHWEKPTLNLYSSQDSKANNLVGSDGFVFEDPLAPPEKRYKMIDSIGGVKATRASPDGIHFAVDPHVLAPFDCDSTSCAFWDDESRRYVVYLRGYPPATPHRSVFRGETPDLNTPLELVSEALKRGEKERRRLTRELPLVMRPTQEDCRDWPSAVDIYFLAPCKYPWAPRTYLGFPTMYYHYSDKTTPKAISKNDGEFDVQLATSRDSKSWHRFPTASGYPPYLARGEYDGLKMYMVSMGQGMIRGDKIYQYFLALPRSHARAAMLNGQWGSYLKDPARTKAWFESDRGGIFRAEQRLDGFTSVDAGPEGGTLVTRPFEFQGRRLIVNVKTLPGGSLSAAVADERGEPLPDLGLSQCDPIQTDSVDRVVTWNGKSELAHQKGKVVRLIFRMKNAKLYAFDVN